MLLDRLGYDEAWIGEHHSGGFETIAAPEVFIAAAARETRRIRLGTGVKSLPYVHPFMVADAMVQLDHMTRGRAMFGVGPGALPSDAAQMGIDARRTRRMMNESLDVIIPLLEGERVSARTDWFTLDRAKLQHASFTRPRMEMAVTTIRSPAGASLAGRHGLGLLSSAGTPTRRWPHTPATGASTRRPPPPRAASPTGRCSASPCRCTSPTPASRPWKTCASASTPGAATRATCCPIKRFPRASPTPAHSSSSPAAASSARPTTPSARSSACRPAPAVSAWCCSCATTGPTGTPQTGATSCSPGTWSRTSRASSLPDRPATTRPRSGSRSSCSRDGGSRRGQGGVRGQAKTENRLT